MELKEFFELNKKAALAFSGGVDSSYLLYAGLKYGADIKPYYVKSQFQPEFEFHDAERLAAGLGADMTVIRADILACRQVRENPPDRCYYCKRTIRSYPLQVRRARRFKRERRQQRPSRYARRGRAAHTLPSA